MIVSWTSLDGLPHARGTGRPPREAILTRPLQVNERPACLPACITLREDLRHGPRRTRPCQTLPHAGRMPGPPPPAGPGPARLPGHPHPTRRRQPATRPGRLNGAQITGGPKNRLRRSFGFADVSGEPSPYAAGVCRRECAVLPVRLTRQTSDCDSLREVSVDAAGGGVNAGSWGYRGNHHHSLGGLSSSGAIKTRTVNSALNAAPYRRTASPSCQWKLSTLPS